jgi:hypothetical protein
MFPISYFQCFNYPLPFLCLCLEFPVLLHFMFLKRQHLPPPSPNPPSSSSFVPRALDPFMLHVFWALNHPPSSSSYVSKTPKHFALPIFWASTPVSSFFCVQNSQALHAMFLEHQLPLAFFSFISKPFGPFCLRVFGGIKPPQLLFLGSCGQSSPPPMFMLLCFWTINQPLYFTMFLV